MKTFQIQTLLFHQHLNQSKPVLQNIPYIMLLQPYIVIMEEQVEENEQGLSSQLSNQNEWNGNSINSSMLLDMKECIQPMLLILQKLKSKVSIVLHTYFPRSDNTFMYIPLFSSLVSKPKNQMAKTAYVVRTNQVTHFDGPCQSRQS